ncbi:MAG: hypothetical protein MUF40_03880 [Gemmatimonadaceae bacterium]|jgi:hypothetical protein|nr:hypothetical protein [Gemmatimonadaceae bacterium]
MRPPDALLDRLYHRLVRALRATGGGDLARPFSVGELTATLVPYRAYRNELGAETLQDYEHGVLLLLAGDGQRLSCDQATVALVSRELASPDPDTSLVRRIASAEVRVTSPESAASLAQLPTPDMARAVTPPASPATPAPTPTSTQTPTSGKASGVVLPSPTGLMAIPTRDGPGAPLAPAVGSPSASVPRTPYAAPALVQPRESGGVRPSAADVASALERLRAMQQEGVATPASNATVAATDTTPTAAATPAPAPAATGATASPPPPPAPPPLDPSRPFGEPIDFRGMRHAPVDVGGVMLLFGLIARDLGLSVEAVTRGVPRADIVRRLPSGQLQRLRTDFELESGNFRDAGRDAAALDLLVCWRDTWPDRPASLQVLELRRVVQHLASRG